MTTHRDAVDAVEAALLGANLDVAAVAADVTPPCCFLRLWTDAEPAVLAGGWEVTVAVHWVPIRGSQDAYADADAADRIRTALDPFATVGPMAQTSVTVNEQTSWPCLRWEVTVP